MRFASSFGLLSLLAVAAIGCSDDAETAASGAAGATSSAAGTGGAGGSGGAGATSGATTGAGGFVPSCVETSGVVLAVEQLYFGDTDTGGTESPTAWMKFGKDIDGLTSDGASVDVCKPNAGGSPAKAYPDGEAGIDNSFGKNIVPLFLQFAATFPQESNDSIDAGGFTLMMRMDGIAPGETSAPFETKVYVGAPLGAAPQWGGEDCWPVLRELLSSPDDIGSSTVTFPASSVTANVWSSGGATDISLSVPAGGGTLTLTVHGARISMDLDADHEGAINGQLGGVLDTEEFVAEVNKLAGGISPIFCTGPIIDDILKQVRQASDIMNDGTQDPAATCNGVSIGLGFKARVVKLGGVAPAADPTPDPCAM